MKHITCNMWYVTRDRWQVTRDTWHMTGDTWHVTCDTWHMTHSVGWTFSQNFSSLALPVWDWQCFEYISTNHHSVSYLLTLINYEAVYRKAPDTPGLLNITIFIKHFPLNYYFIMRKHDACVLSVFVSATLD